METFTVRQLRLYLGFTIPEMAKKMNMHPNTYRNKELGIRKWKTIEAARLLEVTNTESSKVKF